MRGTMTTTTSRERGVIADESFDRGGISSVTWYNDAHDFDAHKGDEKTAVDADGEIETTRRLCATSWDGSVRVYDVVVRQQSSRKEEGTDGGEMLRTMLRETRRARTVDVGSPALRARFITKDLIACGCLDGGVRSVDLTSGEVRVIGTHARVGEDGRECGDGAGVSCVEYDARGTGLLVTCGWDRRIRAWDLAATTAEKREVASVETPGKCYASDMTRDGTLFVAMSDRQILAYDVADLIAGGRPKVNRRSSMRYQTRAIGGHPNEESLVVASVEGRVAVEYVDATRNEEKRYAFKCHRKTEDPTKGEVIYPVHAVAFHPLGTFATGGGDGYVNTWDGAAKKRLFQCPRYPTSISALAFSPCGGLLAVASSYAHEERENQGATPIDRLYVRVITHDEIKPKSRA